MEAVPFESPLTLRCDLGEGPLWHAPSASLWWVDIRARNLHRWWPSTGGHQIYVMPASIGSFAFRRGGGLLVALQTGFHFYDAADGALTPVAAPETHLPLNRMNDGKTDRDGRFWCGSMQDGGAVASGALYRVDPDGRVSKLLDAIRVPNALSFSPDGRTMYFTDTREGVIRAYPYDRATGALGPMRVLAPAGHAPGFPDGATVDSDGCVWSARYAGGCVARITPDGRVDRLVRVPAGQVTACAFGGPALDTLYVTTAYQRMTAEQRAAEPLAGALFALNVGAKGLPEADFAG